MGFRTVVVNSRCKLEFRLNYLVIRGEKDGFIMMQKSVYSRLVINNVVSQALKDKVAQNLPPEGIVELLEITENQFSRIEYLVGEKQTAIEESMDRLIEI